MLRETPRSENGAPVAQLDRASGYEPEGREFESPRAHHSHFMFFVYVLRSQTNGRSYVGYTTNLVQRLGQHNLGMTKSTKNRGPWELIHSETFDSRTGAVRRERFLKSGQGREELKSICNRQQDSSAG